MPRMLAILSTCSAAAVWLAVGVASFAETSDDVARAVSDPNAALYLAVSGGDVSATGSAIEAGADVDLVDDNGWTPLIFAVMMQKSDLVTVLLEGNADPDSVTEDGLTPLLAAITNGDVGLVELLIEAGADIDRSGVDGAPPLVVAAKSGKTAIVRALVDLGANPLRTSKGGTTALMAAAETGQIENINSLIEAGSNPNDKRPDGITALMVASHAGQPEIVTALLEAGADATAKTVDGATALDIADAGKNKEVAELIVAYLPDGLHRAAGRGYLELIETFDASQEALNAKNADGISPLMLAAVQNQTEAALLLLGKGATARSVDKNGNTPLVASALNGDEDLVKVLIAANADHSHQNAAGLTAYDVAKQKGHARVATLLLALDPKAVEHRLKLTREDRALIQYGLNAHGRDAGSADGIFGPRTRAAIARHQVASNALDTGYLTTDLVDTLMAAGAEARTSARIESAERKVREAEEARTRAQQKAVREANRRSLQFQVRNMYSYKVYLQFFSKSRQGLVWPGNGKVYVLADRDFHDYNLRCVPGEKICYGAYSGDWYWGVGRVGNNACRSCCYKCGDSTKPISIRD